MTTPPHKPDCASYDFDPEKQLGTDKRCDCRDLTDEQLAEAEAIARGRTSIVVPMAVGCLLLDMIDELKRRRYVDARTRIHLKGSKAIIGWEHGLEEATDVMAKRVAERLIGIERDDKSDDLRAELQRMHALAASWDSIPESNKEHEALEEIAKNAETALAGGLPHWSKKDFAETVAHCARHALGQPVTFDSVQIRIKLRYNDGRIEHLELDPGVKLTTDGKPPFVIQHEGTAFEWGHNRRSIDGRFIYDEVAP